MLTHDWGSRVGSQDDGLKEVLEKMLRGADTLSGRAGDVKAKVETANLLPGCKPKREFEIWFQSVEEMQKKVQSIKESVQRRTHSSRILLKDQVSKITGLIEELMQHNLPDEPTLLDYSSFNLPLVIGSLKGQLFNENLKQILSFLEDDDVAIIGIHGVGGVGKTTLASHVHKSLCEMFNDGRSSGSVYFVTISHGCTISKLQLKIAKQLGLNIEGEDEMNAARMICDSLRRRSNCVLILDDLWESFRPIDVGLPIGNGGFKLLITSRSSKVCYEIGCKEAEIIRVECLSDDESWDFFRENLGNTDISSQEAIFNVARQVAKECGGLPLALEHIAISMRAADTIEQWRTVLYEMRSMMLEVVDNKVLPLLRYSYDRLRNQLLKDCFLYCSLFPEDYEFWGTNLVEGWIREGLLDDIKSAECQRDKGISIFKELINLSLLKADGNADGRAKMHDLTREMAIKVGKEKGFLVRARVSMQDIPGEQEWTEELHKVSLMHNDIETISPIVAPRCPNLSTLLLNHNFSLTSISSLFFLLMDGLRVLDLSFTKIEKLPDSVSNLKNLTRLLLRYCRGLYYVPSLSMLGKLREMDISDCDQLKDSPHGMEGLVKLEFLDCDRCPVPVSVYLSGLSNLKALKVCSSSEVKGLDLMKLLHLKRLTCRMRNISTFNEYVTSEGFLSLDQYDLHVGSTRGTVYEDEFGVKRTVQFMECSFEEESPIVPGNVEGLGFEECDGVEYLVSSPDSTLIPLQTLEKLVGLDLVRLETFKGLVQPGVILPSGSFSNLLSLCVVECHEIKKLLTPSMARGNLRKLEQLTIRDCCALEEVIGGGSDSDSDSNLSPSIEKNISHAYYGSSTVVDDGQSTYLPTTCVLHLYNLPNFKRVHPDGKLIGKIIGSKIFIDLTALKGSGETMENNC